MTTPVAVVEPNAHSASHLLPTEPGGSRPSETPQRRFTHASGSRPLEGYTIKRGVGYGGFGEVYFATSDAGKEVALKLIRRNLDVELRGIRQCLNLKHPNLLAVFDIRQDPQGDNWVIMEYVTGACLQDVLATQPHGLPSEQALAWMHGMGAGVAYLHDHGIVHRDLKPGNIFSDEGVVKIGDYGLSKFISCSRRSGQTESVGTVHYMAPEVANGRYGKEIDIYALGVILYEMLTGRVPFEGESVGEVLMKHLTVQPDVSMLAEPYRSVVAKALQKDPAQRFRSVGEMLSQLPPLRRGQGYAGPLPSVAGATAAGPGATAGASAAAAAAAHVTPEVVDEEPILHAVRLFCRNSVRTWNESHLSTPLKVVLLLIGSLALITHAGVLVPLAITLLVLYGCYWLVRTAVLAVRGSKPARHAPAPFSTPAHSALVPAAAPRPVASQAMPPAPGPARHGPIGRAVHQALPAWARREAPADALVLKSPREKLAELLGSMLGGALVAAIMCIVAVIVESYHAALPTPSQIAWLLLMSVLGTWAVLVPAKFWEGYQGDQMLRRFIMMVVGLGLGVLAFGLAAWLRVDLPYDPQFPPPHNYELPPSFYADGKPLVLAFLACFGSLFALIRWWRQADPLRISRMSLWSMALCVALAWLVAFVWQFPAQWLMMVACAMSAALQLASPWVHPRHRPRLNGY